MKKFNPDIKVKSIVKEQSVRISEKTIKKTKAAGNFLTDVADLFLFIFQAECVNGTVRVDMLIRKNVQQFIKADSEAGIGSEGIIGDKVLIIMQGSNEAPIVKDGQIIISTEPVETDAIMASLLATAINAEIITDQLAQIMVNINSGEGTIGRLIQDTTISENINQTILNLRRSFKGMDENMEALRHNFLFRGYFKRKAKEEGLKNEKIKVIEEPEK